MSAHVGKQSRIGYARDAVTATNSSPGKRTLVEEAYAQVPGEQDAANVSSARSLGALASPHGNLLQRIFGRFDAKAIAPEAGANQREAPDDTGVASAITAASASAGAALPELAMRRFETSLGADLSGVRVHTNLASANAAASVGAKAYTVGQDIHFAANQYDPASPSGEHLLAHEVAHTVQQSGGVRRRQHKLEVSTPGDASEIEADRAADAMVTGSPAHVRGTSTQVAREKDTNGTSVSLVEVSADSNTITFHTSEGEVTYALTQCDIIEGDFDAKVVIDKQNIKFRIDSKKVPEDAFKFDFRIAPGQKTPLTFFGNQRTVKIAARTGKTTLSACSTLDEFKKRVKEVGKLRMDGNKAHLEEWKTFFTERLSSDQLEGQVMANRANQLGTIAANEGGMTMSTFDDWAKTDNPLLGWVKEQQLEGRYRACTGCHATVQAIDRWRERPSSVAPPPSPLAALEQHAQTESLNAAPRPQNLGQEGVVPDVNRFEGYNAATRVMQAVKTLRPYLDELGPARYNVLPFEVFGLHRSPADLLSMIVANIRRRQIDYDLFKAKIDSPDFDYLMLRPIVQDLLLLATPEVRQQVNDGIASAQKWETVKAIAIGAVTIGLIILTIFPPTSALGMAGVLALETSLGTYGVYSGAEMYQQGSLLAEGRGANNVIDPEQQKSADTMMAMGVVTVGLSVFSLGTTGVRTITLIRGAKDGTRALGAVASIEARLENGSTVRITELAGGNPKIVVLGKDGQLLEEGVLPDGVLMSKPVKMSDLPANGVKGATPRTGTPERPVSLQGSAPTCGPVSCEMIASMGGTVDREVIKRMLLEAGSKGVTTDQMVAMLKWNKVAAEAKIGWKVADLEAATANGNPAVAVIKTANPTHPLHAVVVDGVTVRQGVRVVAIRNPWGVQYFQSEAEFAKTFTGNAVKVLHWY